VAIIGYPAEMTSKNYSDKRLKDAYGTDNPPTREHLNALFFQGNRKVVAIGEVEMV
jgi:hypothetical protein